MLKTYIGDMRSTGSRDGGERARGKEKRAGRERQGSGFFVKRCHSGCEEAGGGGGARGGGRGRAKACRIVPVVRKKGVGVCSREETRGERLCFFRQRRGAGRQRGSGNRRRRRGDALACFAFALHSFIPPSLHLAQLEHQRGQVRRVEAEGPEERGRGELPGPLLGGPAEQQRRQKGAAGRQSA
jgi:hypothetical protein